jgi:hypothetical protein
LEFESVHFCGGRKTGEPEVKPSKQGFVSGFVCTASKQFLKLFVLLSVSDNPLPALGIFHRFTFQAVDNAFLSVDSFFFLR